MLVTISSITPCGCGTGASVVAVAVFSPDIQRNLKQPFSTSQNEESPHEASARIRREIKGRVSNKANKNKNKPEQPA